MKQFPLLDNHISPSCLPRKRDEGNPLLSTHAHTYPGSPGVCANGSPWRFNLHNNAKGGKQLDSLAGHTQVCVCKYACESLLPPRADQL